MKRLVLMFLGMVSGTLCLAAERPLPSPPSGFKAEPESSSTVAMRESAVADSVRAAKPDDLRPNCGGDPNIHFEYGWTAINDTKCKEIISYTGKWTGYADGKMIGIGVHNLYQSQQRGQAWIDEYISKITAVLNEAP
jgi:hypothetical protein